MRPAVIIVVLVLTLGAGYAMFHVTFKVKALESELAAVAHEKAETRESIQVLEAEWSYLNRPDRLKTLANELLPEMGPVKSSQIVPIENVPYPGQEPNEAIPENVRLLVGGSAPQEHHQ